MGRLHMKNVIQKQGRTYFRRKVNGKDQYQRLPSPDDPLFAAEYARLSRPDAPRAAPGKGSIAALVEAYRGSSAFRTVPSANTRTNYGRYLDMIVDEVGTRPAAGMQPQHIRRMLDRLADTPGKANNWLTVMKVLMQFAAERGWRNDNPARGIKRLKLGEHEPWSAELLALALEKASPMLRLAIVSGLCSGLRISDLIRMQHGWHDGETMQVQTQKKDVLAVIPMHPFWLAELAKVQRQSVTILYDRSCKPFQSTEPLQAQLRRLMGEIGGTGFTFHGLRKNAACYLIECGLSEEQVGAILAMSPAMVRHYSKRAATFMLAEKGARRMKRGDVLAIKGGRAQGGPK